MIHVSGMNSLPPPSYLHQQREGAFSLLQQLIQLVFGAISVQKGGKGSSIQVHMRHAAHMHVRYPSVEPICITSVFKNKSPVGYDQLCPCCP